MTDYVQQSSVEEAREYLQTLNLQYIVEAMCASTYPLPRWSLKEAEHCCQLYKNFLFLQKKYSDVSLVPTREIDEFWHNHILYTRQYTEDCQHIFGHYLHHVPTAPDENPGDLIDGFLRTKELYLKEFNEPLTLLLS